MDSKIEFQELKNMQVVTTQQALSFFDKLEIVSMDMMVGLWKGEDFQTSHPLEGCLPAFNWYGKRFIDQDNVHPLIFTDGKNLFSLNPSLMPLKMIMSVPKIIVHSLGAFFPLVRGLYKTKKPMAKLRITEYRGKKSATMIYNDLPIHDVFRKIDETTVLGVMNWNGMQTPYFFVLYKM